MLQTTGHSFFGNASNTAFLNEAFKKEAMSIDKWRKTYESRIDEYRDPNYREKAEKSKEVQRKFQHACGCEPQASPIGYGVAANPDDQRRFGRKKLLDTQFYDTNGVNLFEKDQPSTRGSEILSEKESLTQQDNQSNVVSLPPISPSNNSRRSMSPSKRSRRSRSPSKRSRRSRSPTKRSRRSKSPSKRSRQRQSPTISVSAVS